MAAAVDGTASSSTPAGGPATAAPAAVENISVPLAADAAAAQELPKVKKLNILGFQLSASERGAQKAVLCAGTFLVVLNGFGLPFMLPKLRAFLGAPYVPMKRRYVEVLFDRVLPAWASGSSRATPELQGSLNGLRLVDFGSGDGRLVRAAADRGMSAVGYELNPYLVFWSRLRSTGRAEAQIRWANAWTADLSRVDVVTVYGRPGDGLMAKIAAKCEAEMPHRSVVISHFFEIPGWERLLVQDVDGLKLYDLSLRDPDSRVE